MTATPSLPGYTLVLSRTGEPARVERSGAREPTRVGVGRTPAEVTRLAGLLFPVCAIAQSAAALRASESAAAIMLPKGQAAARETLVLAEAVTGCIWRAALSWPQLLEKAPDPAPVQHARRALDQVRISLFPGNWAVPGGSALKIDPEGLANALILLQQQVDRLRPTADKVIDAAKSFGARIPLNCPPLGDRVNDLSIQPHGATEETPRTVQATSAEVACVADWFAAQASHADTLLDMLGDTSRQVVADASVSMPTRANGTGLGIAMTARGRLRHMIELENGTTTAWKAAAPTDWNLAQGSLLSQLAESARSEAEVQWMIAAADPCAPCSVTFETEAAHA